MSRWRAEGKYGLVGVGKTLNILVRVGKTAQKKKWWDREDKGSGFRKKKRVNGLVTVKS